MSNVVTLTQGKWEQIADNLLSEREGFDEEISKILFNNGHTEIKELLVRRQQIKIYFPLLEL